MENRGFDRRKYNMGGQPDGPCRGNGPGPQDGNRNRAGKNRFWVGASVEALVTAFVELTVVGMSAGIYVFGKRVMSRQPSVTIEGKRPEVTDESGHREDVDFGRVTARMSMIQQIIDLHFLYDEDAGSVKDFIYRRILADLDDPYFMYYAKEDFRSTSDSTKGTYSGIGAMLSQNRTTGLCIIVKVSKGFPILEAGVQPGNIIYKVGGTPVASESLDVLVDNYIKGEEGTDVATAVYRADKGEYADMSVTRRKIEVPTMKYSMLNDKIGRVTALEFDVVAVEQSKQVVGEFQKDGMGSLIIDLKGNLGGVLDSVAKVVDYIPPDDLDWHKKGKGKALTVYTASKNEKDDIYTVSDGHELKIPIAILVNGDSASASEVFMGALKDYDWTTVVGTINYGKRIVQDLIPPGDGSTIKTTTVHYYTSGGSDPHGEGIEPDVEVELNEELKTQVVVEPEEDNQLRKTIQVLKENK